MSKPWVYGLLALAWVANSAASEPEKESAPQAQPGWLAQAREAAGPTFSLRSAYWSDDKSYRDDHHYWVESAWLTLRPREWLGFKAYADGYLQFQDLARTVDDHADLREVYIERSLGDFDLRVGRQILVWGRADKLNPTDNLSVRDYRQLFTDDEDQRTGLMAADLTYNWGAFRFKAVWIPEWRSPGLPLPPLGSGLSWVDVDPAHPRSQFGFKIDHSGAVDGSLSYFHGHGKSPDLVLIPQSTGVGLGLDYPLLDVLGLDFAFAVGNLGIRGETAYTRTPDTSGTSPLAQNPSLFTVVGVEESVVENFNVNVQYLNRWVQGYQDPTAIADPTARLLATQASINAQQLVQMNHGVSVRPSYKLLHDTLELEIAWVRWFTTEDQILRPKATYALTDQWKVLVGGEIYSGPALSFFGRLKDTSSFFAEARWSF